MEQFKCRGCNRELPLDKNHFYKKKDTKTGFTVKCKECQGGRFNTKEIIPEGMQKCKKCNKVLELTAYYFPKDKTCKTGYRGVCKECNNKYSGYGDAKPSVRWTKEENEIMIKYYPTSTYEEMKKLLPNRTKKAMNDHAGTLGIKKNEEGRRKQYKKQSEYLKENSKFIGRVVSDEERARLSQAMKQRWIDDRETMLVNAQYERTEEQKKSISEKAKARGSWKGENNPRHKNPLYGSQNGNYKGGITDVYLWVRNQLDDWKQESMIAANYQCDITGRNFDEIHHLQPFKDIFEEAMEIAGHEGEDISKFNDDELEEFRKVVMEVHDKYGLGICLLKGVHKLFHDTYGYKNTTPEQYFEFKERINDGEFKEEMNEILRTTNKK